MPTSTAVLISRMIRYRKKIIRLQELAFFFDNSKSARCVHRNNYSSYVWYLQPLRWWCWKTPQMASWNGINIVHKVRRPIMTKLFFASHWMKIFPRWVILSEGHLEHSFWLPPWAPTAGHSLFLPGSVPTHSVMPCTCQAPRRDLMYLLTRRSFVSHRKMSIYWLQSL